MTFVMFLLGLVPILWMILAVPIGLQMGRL